jgi:molecular chaperone DnaJ
MGVTTTVSLPSNDACHTCGGRGAATLADYVTCERCGGRGVLNDDQGPFAMSSVCPVCQGRGARIITPCATCHGTGREPSSRRVNVRIPPGVVDGQRIRLKAKGNPGVNGGAPGDLFLDEPVTLKVPAGTQPGTTMRVRTKGVPAHAKHAPGDLLVSVNVTIPKKLTKEQRTLVEKLAVALHEDVVDD